MSTFGKTLRRLRTGQGLTQKQLAENLGLAFSTISMYERGTREPDFETLEAIADFFNVSMDVLHGKSLFSQYDNIIPMPKMRRIPLLGDIACGEPILAQENLDGEIHVPDIVDADFALRCKGDSMIGANIYNGDIVYIKQQPIVNNGEIAVVLIGEEATLKRFYRNGDKVTLMPCNTMQEPFVYQGKELEDIRILGKAVYYLSRVK